MPNGGVFDGALGVVAAVEVVAALRDARATLRHPLLRLAFAEEEGTSFGGGCLGSLGLVGRASVPETLRDLQGNPLPDLLRAFDLGVPRRAAPVVASLELHIEQGPMLAAQGTSLAAVEVRVGVSAPRSCSSVRPIMRGRLRWTSAGTRYGAQPIWWPRSARSPGTRAVGTVHRDLMAMLYPSVVEHHEEALPRITAASVSTIPPRECGIATPPRRRRPHRTPRRRLRRYGNLLSLQDPPLPWCQAICISSPVVFRVDIRSRGQAARSASIEPVFARLLKGPLGSGRFCAFNPDGGAPLATPPADGRSAHAAPDPEGDIFINPLRG